MALAVLIFSEGFAYDCILKQSSTRQPDKKRALMKLFCLLCRKPPLDYHIVSCNWRRVTHCASHSVHDFVSEVFSPDIESHRQQWGKAISKWKQYWSWLYPDLRYEIFNIYLLYAVKAESF